MDLRAIVLLVLSVPLGVMGAAACVEGLLQRRAGKVVAALLLIAGAAYCADIGLGGGWLPKGFRI